MGSPAAIIMPEKSEHFEPLSRDFIVSSLTRNETQIVNLITTVKELRTSVDEMVDRLQSDVDTLRETFGAVPILKTLLDEQRARADAMQRRLDEHERATERKFDELKNQHAAAIKSLAESHAAEIKEISEKRITPLEQWRWKMAGVGLAGGGIGAALMKIITH